MSLMANARQGYLLDEMRRVALHRVDFLTPEAEDAVAIAGDKQRRLSQLRTLQKRGQRPVEIVVSPRAAIRPTIGLPDSAFGRTTVVHKLAHPADDSSGAAQLAAVAVITPPFARVIEVALGHPLLLWGR